MKITEAIAHLREAERAATKGPLCVEVHGTAPYDKVAIVQESTGHTIALACEPWARAENRPIATANALLYTLLRNVAPQALTLIECAMSAVAAREKEWQDDIGEPHGPSVGRASADLDAATTAFAEAVGAQS